MIFGIITSWEGIETINDGEMYLLFLDKLDENEEVKTDDPCFGKYRPIPPVGIYKIGSKDANTLKS